MNLYRKHHRIVSFRRTALLILSGIAVPLLAVILLFELTTARNHRTNVSAAYRSTLSAYQRMADNSLDTAQGYITDAAANSIDFQMIVHAKSKTEFYLAAIEMEKQCRPLLQAHELIGGFYIYSSAFGYCHTVNAANYPHEDLDTIQAAVRNAAVPDSLTTGWTPLTLSDRTVFLYSFTTKGNVLSTMVDPSRQTHSGLETGGRIFFTTKDGTPLSPQRAFDAPDFPAPARWDHLYCSDTGDKYDLIHLPLRAISGYIVYAVPHETFFGQLSAMQRFLMILTLCLLLSIPVSWLLLRNLLLQPLNSLTETTQAIKTGHTDTRVPQNSNVYEVNAIAGTVNTMLDTIQQQKIEAYEWELSVRDLRLQYLQLQLRPHFFLNCLNLIYSLAGEKKYADLQELTLYLSAYLRNTLKDGSKLIALSSELNSVESYVRIQGIGTQRPPQFTISVQPAMADIPVPPLCVLTFVENAVKHASPPDTGLLIRIKCTVLASEEGSYLNITVCDNGGGFPPEKLQAFHMPFQDLPAEDGHIGIPNILHRLRFLYGAQATVSFRNRSDGACVELFLPVSDMPDANLHSKQSGVEAT